MNRRKKVAFIWLAVSLLSFAAVAFTFIKGFNGASADGAIILVGLLAGITGLITFFLYMKMAAAEKDIVTEATDQLLKWEYDGEEWRRFAADQFKVRVKVNRGTWKVIAVISVVSILPIWFMTGDIAYAVLFVIGLLIFLLPFIYLPPFIQKRRILKSQRTAIIAANGVIIGKELHLFDLKVTWLNSLTIGDEYILFNYSAIASPTIVADYDCRIPVKQGGGEDIDRLVDFFSGIEKPPKITDNRKKP